MDSQDEFRDLALVYNDMMARIDNLIDTVYSKELLVKSAELKAFQAQINPHFIYNTLDCINSLVDLNRPEDVKKDRHRPGQPDTGQRQRQGTASCAGRA